MIIARRLYANQAWWLLCKILPNGTAATDALQRAQRIGADHGHEYHVRFDREKDRYDVMLWGYFRD
jgi:hypothetical protein